MEEEIRILFLAAGAGDENRQHLLEREAREIDKRLHVGTNRDSFKLITEWEVRARDLQEILLRHQPHIVHLSGQGTKEGDIVLAHDPENSRTVDRRAVADLIRILKDNIHLIVFNDHHTQQLAQEVKEIIDYTVSMSETVNVENAITFFTYFYQALSFGRTIVEAFDLGKNQLRLEGETDYKKPVLHVRDAADMSWPPLERPNVRRPAKTAKIWAAGSA